MHDRSWRSVLVTFLIAVPACLVSYFLASWLGGLAAGREGAPPSQLSQITKPGLFIDPAELNLGEVWEDPDFIATVQLQNTSDCEVAISKFVTSCDCSGVEPPSPVVPPKGSIPLRVKINLTHRLPYAWGVERRPFSLAIHPIVKEAGVAPNGWEFTAVIRSRVALSEQRIDFADKCTQDGSPVRRTVRATAYLPLAALEAVAQPRKALVQVTPIEGTPGKNDIAITPDPKLPIGPFRFEVPVTAVTPDGIGHPCATIQVVGEMQPSTRIVPGIVLLGEHPVGAEATAEVSVRFPDRAGWSVDHIEIDSPNLNLVPNGTFEDGALRYRISQRITELGDQEKQVKFHIRKPHSKLETVKMKVRCHGAAADKRYREVGR